MTAANSPPHCLPDFVFPQASLLTSLVGLDADGSTGLPVVSPCLPGNFGRVRLEQVSFGGQTAAVEAEGHRATVALSAQQSID